MAVIEIARIQVRRGQENQTGVPQLAGGEFAWAADTEHLYIGLSREDGGARDANVRILTENDLRNLNFFTPSVLSPLSSTSTYVYRQGTLITAQDNINEFQRTVQKRLDELDVSIENFGLVGQGGDDTATFQYAIDRLFLDTLALPGDPARTLVLPTGTFRISDTVFIPKNTRIVGQGPGKTIILITAAGSHAFQTVDANSAGATSFITFPSINSNTQPDYVCIENLTIEVSSAVNVTQALSLVSLDCANNAIIRNVKFKGYYTVNLGTPLSSNAGVEIRGLGSVTSENVLIDNCSFEGLYYGIRSNYDILNPNINNCKFSDLSRGIVFNDSIDPLASTGPRFARISNNRFKNIAREAIFVGSNVSTTSTNHISIGNQYINVGNNIVWNEQSSTGTAVIKFNTDENLSINDYFNRYEYQYSRAGEAIKYNPLIEGNLDVVLVGNRTVLIPSGNTRCVLRIPLNNLEQYIVVKYNASSSLPVSRSGVLDVNIGRGATPTVSITDNYNYVSAAEGNINWSTSVDASYSWVELRAQNSDAATLTIEHKSTLMV